MKKSIRIVLVDDHKVVRRGVANLLNKEAGIKVEFDVSNGSELLAELKNHKIDVVLLDINMPITLILTIIMLRMVVNCSLLKFLNYLW